MADTWTPPSYATPIESDKWVPPSYAKPIDEKPEEESFLTKARNFMFNPLLPEVSEPPNLWEQAKYKSLLPSIGSLNVPLNTAAVKRLGYEFYENALRPLSAPIGLAALFGEGYANRPTKVPVQEPLPIRQPKLLGTRIPEEPVKPINTGFIGGDAGIAQSGRTYPLDLGPNRIPTLENGTILPREYGEVVQIPPSLAARQGLEIGKPARAPLESPNPNLKLLNRAPDFVSEEAGIKPITRDWTPPKYAEPIYEPEINTSITEPTVTLYRGNSINGMGRTELTKEANGRWFTKNPKEAESYIASGGGGNLVNIEIPAKDLDSYRVSNLDSNIQRYSTDPQNHFFLPSELAKTAIESGKKPVNQILEDFQKSLRDKGIIKPKLQEEAIPELSTGQKAIESLKKLVSSEEGSLDVDRMKQLLKENAERFGKMDWYKTALAKIDDGDYGAASRIIKSALLPPEESKMSYRDLVKRYANFDGNRNKQVPIDPTTEIYRNPAENPALGKLMDALNEAGPRREQQEALYSMERARRINAAESIKTPGLEGFYKQLGKLKGELPKVNAQEYGLTGSDVDSLVDNVTNSQKLLPYEKIRAKTGLLKLLSGEQLPQRNELSLLGEVFGNQFTDLVMMHGGLAGPVPLKVAIETANLMKTTSASVDLSAPLRQGLPLIHRLEYWKSFDNMFSVARSEDAYQGLMDSIEQRPNYLLGREAGLRLTNIGSDLSQREEQFLSKWAEKIPGVRPSERAYVGFLNKLRADTFDSLIDNAKIAGLDVKQGSQLSREIANYVNISTGRGSLGRFEKIGTELNGLLFSPRLLASRLTILNPNYYIKADPFVRKEALKSLLAIGGVGAITLGLNELAGGSTSTNPLSADFLKAKQDNTRLDPWGGFQQYIVAAARLIQGKTDSNATGSYAPTRFSIAENFGANKLSPAASLIYTLMRGQVKTDRFGNTKRVDPFGNEMNVGSEIGKRFVPMIMQDLYDVYQDNPNLLPMGIGAAFGMGMQTYDSEPKRLRYGQ